MKVYNFTNYIFNQPKHKDKEMKLKKQNKTERADNKDPIIYIGFNYENSSSPVQLVLIIFFKS